MGQARRAISKARAERRGGAMSGLIVFLRTYRIPEGKLEEWKQANTEMTRLRR
jgi:hypothetical protein